MLVVVLSIALAISGGVIAAPQAVGASAPKAVFIVGPSGSATNTYKARADAMANSAEAQGMDVRRIYHPNATWERVLDNIQNAKLVVYLGHGNGWPSPYGPFQTNTKNGFGLNPTQGASANTTKYFGEGPISKKVKLAENAVVWLQNLCYAAGNGEPGMSIPGQKTAKERVDNFAAGFLAAGARVVFAMGWLQKLDMPKALHTPGQTMDDLFMTTGGKAAYVDGFLGKNNKRLNSERTPGATIHLDPSPAHGYLRAVTGDLSMTTDEWLGVAADQQQESDTEAPTLSLGLPTVDRPDWDASLPSFSPNKDTLKEGTSIPYTVSEAVELKVRIRDESGELVRGFSSRVDKGSGNVDWDGNRDTGKRVLDGRYWVTLIPVDLAGNEGTSKTTGVAVVTALRTLTVSNTALKASSDIETASTSEITVEVKRPGDVNVNIQRKDGSVVRTFLKDERVKPISEPLEPTILSFSWDGRNNKGNLLPSGRYFAYVSSTNSNGHQAHRIAINLQ